MQHVSHRGHTQRMGASADSPNFIDVLIVHHQQQRDFSNYYTQLNVFVKEREREWLGEWERATTKQQFIFDVNMSCVGKSDDVEDNWDYGEPSNHITNMIIQKLSIMWAGLMYGCSKCKTSVVEDTGQEPERGRDVYKREMGASWETLEMLMLLWINQDLRKEPIFFVSPSEKCCCEFRNDSET